jgi:hypothetical protein
MEVEPAAADGAAMATAAKAAMMVEMVNCMLKVVLERRKIVE